MNATGGIFTLGPACLLKNGSLSFTVLLVIAEYICLEKLTCNWLWILVLLYLLDRYLDVWQHNLLALS